MATMPSAIRSRGVLTFLGETPLASAKVVLAKWSALARRFILATNASVEPASQRASVSAMLFPEGMSSASRAWNSESCSPARTSTTDCISAASAW